MAKSTYYDAMKSIDKKEDKEITAGYLSHNLLKQCNKKINPYKLSENYFTNVLTNVKIKLS